MQQRHPCRVTQQPEQLRSPCERLSIREPFTQRRQRRRRMLGPAPRRARVQTNDIRPAAGSGVREGTRHEIHHICTHGQMMSNPGADHRGGDGWPAGPLATSTGQGGGFGLYDRCLRASILNGRTTSIGGSMSQQPTTTPTPRQEHRGRTIAGVAAAITIAFVLGAGVVLFASAATSSPTTHSASNPATVATCGWMTNWPSLVAVAAW